MTTHIVINGTEVTNPVAKASIVFAAILLASLISALLVFVLLPIMGVAVTLSVGFVLIFMIPAIVGIAMLIIGATMLGWLFGPTEFRFRKIHKRK